MLIYKVSSLLDNLLVTLWVLLGNCKVAICRIEVVVHLELHNGADGVVARFEPIDAVVALEHLDNLGTLGKVALKQVHLAELVEHHAEEILIIDLYGVVTSLEE